MTEAKLRTNEPPGTPPRLKSDLISLAIFPVWTSSGQIVVQQRDPFPRGSN
jgi:hypothetical protein